MTTITSTDYYVVRERRERDLADASNNTAVAAAHRGMAERYEKLIVASRLSGGFDEPHRP